jgi:hypothetical protein
MKIPIKQIFRELYLLNNRLSLVEKVIYSLFSIALVRAVYLSILNFSKKIIAYVLVNYQTVSTSFLVALTILIFGLGLYLYIFKAKHEQKSLDEILIDNDIHETHNIYTGGGNYNENINGDQIEIYGDVTININQDFSEVAQQITELIKEMKNQGYSEEDAKTQIVTELAEEARKKPKVRKKLLNWKKSFSTNTNKTNDETEVARQVVNSATAYRHTDSKDFTEVGSGYYQKLDELLKASKWKEADLETARIISSIAQNKLSENLPYMYLWPYYYYANSRNIRVIPKKDLNIIDKLWKKYSNGRFGFTIQKRIWQSLGGGSDTTHNSLEIQKQFGDKVGWRKNGDWLYYVDLNYSKKAPYGHLPIIFMLYSDESQRCNFNFSILEVIVGRM